MLFSYRCHRCKKMREPGEYSEEVYTSRIKTTCDICYEKKKERERVKLEERANRTRIRENLVVEAAREREHNVVDSDIEEQESLVPVVEIVDIREARSAAVDSFEDRRELESRMCAAAFELKKMKESPLYNLNNVSFGYG